MSTGVKQQVDSQTDSTIESAPAAQPSGVAHPTDWWGAGKSTTRATQIVPPVIIYPKARVRSRVLPGLMVTSGAVAIAGSALPWITAHFLRFTADVDGTSHVITTAFGLNGWVTIAGGAGVLLLGALMMISDETSLRVLGSLFATATAGFSTYELVRVLQKLHYGHSAAVQLGPFSAYLAGRAHVGYGLIMLVSAAGVAALAALLELNAASRD